MLEPLTQLDDNANRWPLLCRSQCWCLVCVLYLQFDVLSLLVLQTFPLLWCLCPGSKAHRQSSRPVWKTDCQLLVLSLWYRYRTMILRRMDKSHLSLCNDSDLLWLPASVELRVC